jgi:signal transduction histidine kinase
MIRADRRRLAQVFSNLLANAFEHGAGRVVLRGRRGRSGISVDVLDEGAGFNGRRRPSPAGRGRGLAIAAQAAEEVGGTLSVGRSDGRGRVTVDFPAAEG